MSDRDERLIAGVLIGGVVVWLLCRRRRAMVSGSTNTIRSSSAGSSCGCGPAGAAASAAIQRQCPPVGQTSYDYDFGYSQAPAYEYRDAYTLTNLVPIPTAPIVIAAPVVQPRYGFGYGSKLGMYGYGWGS